MKVDFPEHIDTTHQSIHFWKRWHRAAFRANRLIDGGKFNQATLLWAVYQRSFSRHENRQWQFFLFIYFLSIRTWHHRSFLSRNDNRIILTIIGQWRQVAKQFQQKLQTTVINNPLIFSSLTEKENCWLYSYETAFISSIDSIHFYTIIKSKFRVRSEFLLFLNWKLEKCDLEILRNFKWSKFIYQNLRFTCQNWSKCTFYVSKFTFYMSKFSFMVQFFQLLDRNKSKFRVRSKCLLFLN